ncbi:MAG: head-tail connector protein [Pseudomonadota bacterium]
MLIEETPIPDAALPLEAFKAHLRLGSGFGPADVQDAMIASFLRAAIAAVEARTGKAVLQRRFNLVVSEWHARDAHVLPVAPVEAVARVERVAADGTRTLVDPGSYWLQRDLQRPRLRASGSLPDVPDGGTLEMLLEAGYASAWEDVPADLGQAVLMLAAHYYEYRNDTGLSAGCMPFGVSSLIERFKQVRLGAGAAR